MIFYASTSSSTALWTGTKAQVIALLHPTALMLLMDLKHSTIKPCLPTQSDSQHLPGHLRDLHIEGLINDRCAVMQHFK